MVRDPDVHREVLTAFAAWLRDGGLILRELTASPIRGPAGNVEFFAHVSAVGAAVDAASAVDGALAGAPQ